MSYTLDYYGWTEQQSRHLLEGDFSKLDLDNLIEELKSLGQSERRALESYYVVYYTHLLKQQFQPTMASRSWSLSIENSKRHIDKITSRNPSLKFQLDEIKEDAYIDARFKAAMETGLELNVFPEVNHYK